MSPPPSPSTHAAADDTDADAVDEEIVDGEPVLEERAGQLTVAPAVLQDALAPLSTSTAVQAAAAAATGFVAGAATLAIARRTSGRRRAQRTITRRAAEALPIVGTRSFVIDIHMLRSDG